MRIRFTWVFTVDSSLTNSSRGELTADEYRERLEQLK